MKELKTQLYESIAKYGLKDFKTIELSQKLDLLIVKEMRRWTKKQ